MVQKEKIMDKLKEVMDPETKLSIVDMGFIYNLKVENGEVSIEMTLTTPGCPLHERFVQKVKDEVSELEDVDEVDVELTFDPPWSPERMSDEAKAKLGLEE